MSNQKYTWGFCQSCNKNGPHFRAFSFGPLRTLDRLSFKILKAFRLGPWYCSHCETKTIYLKNERPEFDIEERPARTRQKNTSNSKPEQDVAQPVNESVGNFIKGDQSLVVRSTRLKRFSEKYRDSVVKKMLTGKSTILQIREEQNISEAELLDWVADLLARLTTKIAAMESGEFDTYEQNSSASLQASHLGVTLEGQVKPK